MNCCNILMDASIVVPSPMAFAIVQDTVQASTPSRGGQDLAGSITACVELRVHQCSTTHQFEARSRNAQSYRPDVLPSVCEYATRQCPAADAECRCAERARGVDTASAAARSETPHGVGQARAAYGSD